LVTRIKIKNILYKEIIVVNDTISDMLTRIRNANMVKHQIVQIPATKMSLAIAEILKEEGFIEDFESYEENKKNIINFIKIYWKIRKPVICKLNE
jgi:small subunit ribosomal protein S8